MRNGGIATTRLDITALKEEQAARRELEQQLQHSQKLEALGVLAGGIAHDLNNTLVPIFVTAKLGIKHAAEDGRMRQRFELIYDAGVRARDLIKRILAFSRKDTIHRQGFRLDRILSDDLEMLRHSISTTIAIEADIQPVPEIFGDPDQMRQVVVNLVTNAVHAIGGDLGTVAVSLTPVAEGAADEKPIIRLRVRDTGCGMDEATKRRIFEPFFTTKPVGEGTGLGLSMVHGVVTSLGGAISVESEPGKGTCFTIELPPMTAPADCVPAREEVAA
jgi:signal transduction histidine kinase